MSALLEYNVSVTIDLVETSITCNSFCLSGSDPTNVDKLINQIELIIIKSNLEIKSGILRSLIISGHNLID